MRAARAGLALVLLGSGALAEGPAPAGMAGCEGFDWSLSREQAWFAAPGLPELASGAALPAGSPAAVLRLKPHADAKLPVPPTRTPKPDSFAGVLTVDAPATPGRYQITLSDEGWIDVNQEGEGPRKPAAHTGKRTCPGLRKSLRYELAAKPFSITISNATADAIRIAVAPAE